MSHIVTVALGGTGGPEVLTRNMSHTVRVALGGTGGPEIPWQAALVTKRCSLSCEGWNSSFC